MSDRAPRLLILASEFPPGPGGIGTHAHQVAVHLERRGWQVQVVAPQNDATEEEVDAFSKTQAAEIHRVRRFGGAPLKLAYRLAIALRVARLYRPDVIMASGQRMVWLASLVGRQTRTPVVPVAHARELSSGSAGWQRWLNRRSLRDAAVTVCVSHYTQSEIEAVHGAGLNSVVIHNGADDRRFRCLPDEDAAAFRRRFGFEGVPLLVTVGSVHPRKGQDVVIRALPQVLRRCPDVQYALVGSPRSGDEFAALARQLGVADHVHLLGILDAEDVVRALNAADLFLMTSRRGDDGDFEGFGIAVVEAALCGRAAVVSDNSGVSEAIRPGVTGLVARMGDPDSTAERIVELFSDRGRLAEMSRCAREDAAARRTWSQRCAEYDRLLRSLGLMSKYTAPRVTMI